jgi:aminoglycoside 6'-N-acetyltransferase-1b
MTEISLRPLSGSDVPQLHEWLGRSHVREWWGDVPTLEELSEQCDPEVLASEGVEAFVATSNGKPVGFVQVYVAMGSGEGWWETETDPGVRGIDLFLADAEKLGTGLGTRLVRHLVDELFADPAVTKLQADPSPDNRRAIRCFEKAGFLPQGIIATPDGKACYMTLDRGSARPAGSLDRKAAP